MVARIQQSDARESYVRSVDRVVDILECLVQSERQWTLSLIARELSLPPSTTHRLLGALERRQIVFRHPDSDVYTLGYRLLSYAASVEQMADIRQIAMPELHRLRDTTHATSALCLLSGRERVTAAVLPNPGEFSIVARTGKSAPLHEGCFSRVMLAFLPIEERNEYLSSLANFDVDSLLGELADIKTRRYAVTTSGMLVHVGGIAAPIFRRDGRVVASVGILVPAQTLGTDSGAALGEQVRQAAQTISDLTGYIDNS